MMTMILLTLMTSICFLFLWHPLSFGLILMIQTILIALITGLLNYNYWFSYMLFLIMVGGMLVLFMYMTSIASNEKFKFSSSMLYMIMFMMILTLSFMFMDNFLYNMNLFMYDLENQEMLTENQMSLNKYFNNPSSLILILILSYLLITMIMVVKITKIEYGPLRQSI
uniref:NADH-ubiquinone oxidoreductase chain 6 n=1 Tax=Rhipidocerus australasiae TaxID=2547846 RepID=A0A6H0N1V5_9CUCU|nr:NADH dehydrogenase subunit 6 [Rhipidocerus australasiae]